MSKRKKKAAATEPDVPALSVGRLTLPLVLEKDKDSNRTSFYDEEYQLGQRVRMPTIAAKGFTDDPDDPLATSLTVTDTSASASTSTGSIETSGGSIGVSGAGFFDAVKEDDAMVRELWLGLGLGLGFSLPLYLFLILGRRFE